MNIFLFIKLLLNRDGLKPFCKTKLSEKPFLEKTLDRVSSKLENSVRLNDALAVADFLKVGQKVQFQSPDIEFSQKEIQSGLEELIHGLIEKLLSAILLNCLGRSKIYFKNNKGNLDRAKMLIGSSLLCGAFLQGEIEQINGNNHLYDYIASWGLLVRS